MGRSPGARPLSPLAQPFFPTVVGPPAVPAATIPDFIQSFKLPLQPSLIKSAPKLSQRHLGKSPMRHPKPEVQAKRVMLNKWKSPSHSPQLQTPDESIALKFHQTFADPLSSTKRAAMCELFPALAESVRWCG